MLQADARNPKELCRGLFARGRDARPFSCACGFVELRPDFGENTPCDIRGRFHLALEGCRRGPDACSSLAADFQRLREPELQIRPR